METEDLLDRVERHLREEDFYEGWLLSVEELLAVVAECRSLRALLKEKEKP